MAKEHPVGGGFVIPHILQLAVRFINVNEVEVGVRLDIRGPLEGYMSGRLILPHK